jgi:serine/threonine-protein phosphatase 6 regulatory ankyrin repeat subunit B
MSSADLIAACNAKNAKAVAAALAAGADVDAKDVRGNPVLHVAIELKSKPVVKVLVDAGANLETLDREGRTALIHLAEDLPDVALGTLVIAKGAKLDALDTKRFSKRSALHFAVKRKKLEFAELLLDRGANIDVVDGEDLHTPLHDLAKSKSGVMSETEVAAALMLIDRGADVMKATDNGETALHFAARSGSLKVIDALVAKGAKITRSKQGKTPLYYCLSTNDKCTDIWDRLRELGCGLDDQDDRGRTPLHEAQICWNPFAVSYLLKAGAKRDIADHEGLTPLDSARKLNQAKIIPLLEKA